ncbi:hypothetical protein D9O50_04515 [Oxalobacteraceae bacterium CAVE-383]|nr:hypothetical protein D9O50_04515 [Oxalobacteraceae bacterium CAVE-383]
MADNITAPIDMNAISAPYQMQAPMQDQMPAAGSMHDVLRFERVIAAFESSEAENKASITQMLRSDAKITPTTVLAFNAALEERNIGYSFARQMISAPSQWIKELTSMQ